MQHCNEPRPRPAKKMLAAVLTLFVSGAITACGGSPSAPSASNSLDFGGSPPTHEEIVTRAQEESGELQVAGTFHNDTATQLAETFKEKYPWANPVVSDVSSDAASTILLELASGRHEGDIIKIEENRWTEYEPFMQQVDLVAMTQNGSLNLGTPAMVDARSEKLFAWATYLGATAWNPEVTARFGVDMNQVKTHEDLLKVCDKLPQGQMATDASPEQLAPLGMLMGDDWLYKYATEFFDRCKPVFTRGGPVRLTGVASGEWAISHLGNLHAVLNEIDDGGKLDYKVLEPVTGKMSGLTGIRAGTERPFTALLWLEHMASPQAQTILDIEGPVSSFIPNGGDFPAAEGTTNWKLVQGQETSISDWPSLSEYSKRIHRIQEIWGFPTGIE